MNFSNLLNHDEGASNSYDPLEGQQDASLASTRMSFDYLNSQQNMSPAGLGSPAFFSTPSEFVAESDNEGMATSSMNQPSQILDNSFNSPFGDPSALLGGQDYLYNALQQPPSFSQQYPSYPSFPSQPSDLTQQDPSSSLNPFSFSSSFPYDQHTGQLNSTTVPDTAAAVPETDDEKPKKPPKARGRGKGKVKAEDSVNSDGSSSAGPSKPSSRAPKTKGSAKAKRNTLLASSNHSSPAPSPGPSSLANEVTFDAQDPEEDDDRESFSKPIPVTKEEQLKPLTTDHLKTVTDPDSAATLPSPFRNYVPPRIGPNGAVVSDSEDEDEDLVRKRAQAKRSATLAAKGKSRARIEEEEREEADDRLYCICREHYEPERMMIACDRCEEWYHIECVKIPDDSVELVDQFFCPPCQTKYSVTTTWHSACARPTCRKPAVALSKYCCDYCGVSVVSARLELLKLANGTDPNTFWGRVEGSHRKEAKVIDETGSNTRQDSSTDFQAIEDARTLSRLESKLKETNSRRIGLSEAISMVEKRLLYLKIVIKRWERLCQATADELANAGIGNMAGSNTDGAIDTKPTGNKRGGKKKGKAGKKKGPVAATSLPEAQCGLDVRLVYDDEAWKEWVDLELAEITEESGESRQEPGGKNILAAQERGDDQVVLQMALEMLSGVCLETRKKCERHTGWQKLREADFQVEKAVLHRRLDRLNSLSQSLESQIALHQQATAFRLSNYNRSASPSRLISVDSYMKDQETLHPRVKSSGGGFGRGGRRSTSPVVNRPAVSQPNPNFRRSDFVAGGEDGEASIDIPSELLPFLSRAEIAKLKAQKK
ncbi:hypothetical protein JCM3765_005629 [Sporobolomyces pararoseus]